MAEATGICTEHSGLRVALENTAKRLEEDVSDKKRIYEVIDDLKNLLMEHRDDVSNKISEYSKSMADQQAGLHSLIEDLVLGKEGLEPRVKRMEMLWGITLKICAGVITFTGAGIVFFKESLIKIVKWWAA